ncbi:MAG: hypothetical protein RL223_3539 [Pseudomonadota bacterium]|jgi:putative PEP-CTERM system TPR-repeat lipoprotein
MSCTNVRSRPWRPVLAAVAAAALLALAGCKPDDTAILAAARQQLEQGRLDDAATHLKDVLARQPGSGEARALLGRVHLAAGDAVAAEAELRRALQAGQAEDRVLPPLARAMLAQGRAAALTQEFGTRRLADDAAAAEFGTTLAEAHAQQRDTAAAARTLDALLQRLPTHLPARLMQLRLQAATDPAGALAALDRLLTEPAAGASAAAHQLRGELRLAAGQAEAAIGDWQRAVALQPGAVEAYVALIPVLLERQGLEAAKAPFEQLRQQRPGHPQTRYFDALLALRAGELPRAASAITPLLRGAPSDARVLMLAGEIAHAQGQHAQAFTHFAKVLQAAPGYALARRWLARAQADGGQPDKALQTLKPLLDAQPPDAQALTLASGWQLRAGDAAGAQASLARAAQVRPDDARLQAVQRLAAVAPDAPAARQQALQQELERLAARDRGPRIDLALVATRLRAGDPEGALKAVDALAAKQGPASPLADHLRGRIAVLQGRPDLARAAFGAALKTDADFLPALAGLAAVDLAEGRAVEARQRYEALVKRQPAHAEALQALALLARREGRTAEVLTWLERAVQAAPSDAAVRRALIDELLGQHQNARAVDAARAALVALPQDGSLHERLGRAQLADGQPQAAVSSFGQWATLQPRQLAPLIAQAEAQAAAGELRAAGATLQRARAIDEAHPALLRALAAQALREDRPDEALRQARRLQQLPAVAADGHRLEGDLAVQGRQWPQAVAAYQQALRLAADPADLPIRLHTTLLAAGRADEAARLAEDWQRRHPTDMLFQLRLADAAALRRELPQAEQLYRQTLQRFPGQPMAQNNLAWLLCSQRKPGGVALARQALATQPSEASFHDTLASCLAAEGQLPQAIRAQQQALALSGGAPRYRLQLARWQLMAGERAPARTELRQLQRLGPRFDRQAEVEALLKSVGG